MTQADTGFEMLLVRQVQGLVTATAEVIAESTGGDPLEIEAHLHKVRAVNCETAAQTAQALAAEPDDPAAERDDEAQTMKLGPGRRRRPWLAVQGKETVKE